MTVVNPLGSGKLRVMPVIFGLDDSGRRVVALSPWYYDQGEMSAFVAESGLPVEGDELARVGTIGALRRFPMAAELRRQLWIGVAISLPMALIYVVGLVLILIAVR